MAINVGKNQIILGLVIAIIIIGSEMISNAITVLFMILPFNFFAFMPAIGWQLLIVLGFFLYFIRKKENTL